MNDVFLYIGGISLLSFPIAVLVWFIQKIRKKPTKKYSILCVVLFVSFMVFESIGVYLMCEHEFQATSFEQPTCARTGESVYVCVLCGDEKIEEIPMLEHDLIEMERYEATEDYDGKITMECSVCGYQEFIAIPRIVVACSHVWSKPSCVEPQICTLCGESEGAPNGHSWSASTCEEAKKCSVCGMVQGQPLGHSWSNATCEEAKKCSVCGAVQGQPLGHSWSNATCISPKRCAKCNAEEGTTIEHEWEPATCTKPKVCSVCHVEDGKALEHDWISVSCTNLKTCSKCGKNERQPEWHNWIAASCTTPKICSTCEKEEGEPLGHSEGEWIVEAEIAAGYYTLIKRCSNCGYQLDMDMKFYDYMHENGHFLFNAEEYADRLEGYFSVLGIDYEVELTVVEGDLLLKIMSGSELVAAMKFSNENGYLNAGQLNAREIVTLVTLFYNDSAEHTVACMLAIMCSCDPQLEVDDAAELAKNVMISSTKNETFIENGVGYAAGYIDDSFMIFTSVTGK